jgi:hypothetical protein
MLTGEPSLGRTRADRYAQLTGLEKLARVSLVVAALAVACLTALFWLGWVWSNSPDQDTVAQGASVIPALVCSLAFVATIVAATWVSAWPLRAAMLSLAAVIVVSTTFLAMYGRPDSLWVFESLWLAYGVCSLFSGALLVWDREAQRAVV